MKSFSQFLTESFKQKELDLTDFRSIGNFQKFQKTFSLDKTPTLIKMGRFNTAWWKFESDAQPLHIYTSCNPLTGKYADSDRQNKQNPGYCSYIVIEAEPEMMRDVEDYINSNASVK